MSTEQTCSRPVMFTEDSPIDVVKAVTRDQTVPAGRTGKTLGKNISLQILSCYYQDELTDNNIMMWSCKCFGYG